MSRILEAMDRAGRAVDRCVQAAATLQPLQMHGRVVRVIGPVVHATVPSARVGEMFDLQAADGSSHGWAEVIGFSNAVAVLVPLRGTHGLSPDSRVVHTGQAQQVQAGWPLLGRVIDAMGQPMDAGPSLPRMAPRPLYAAPPEPLERARVHQPMPLGVRALDALLTCGEGQRMGIFAGPGVGKTSLMGMLVRNAEVDVCVVGLVGERGREVRDLVECELGPRGMERSVVVCATSDRSPMERARAAYLATAIAEFFREAGLRVLLLVDSLTRFARAQREIGLAAGEPPTRRGFPPSMFAALPRLLERAGNDARGSITAFYTVLVEGDDTSDPVAEEVRSILDGHIVLSPRLASAGHFPAIDVLASTSRVMNALVTPPHLEAAARVRELMAKHADIELLLQVGEYQPGNDALADLAIERHDAIKAFLRQGQDERVAWDEAIGELAGLGD